MKGHELMEHGTTILFGLPGMGVRGVEVDPGGGRVVHVVTLDQGASACPSLRGVLDVVEAEPHHRVEGSSRWECALVVRWHKRRLRCVQVGCPRKTFTETIEEVPAGARLRGGSGGRWPARSATRTVRSAKSPPRTTWGGRRRTGRSWTSLTRSWVNPPRPGCWASIRPAAVSPAGSWTRPPAAT